MNSTMRGGGKVDRPMLGIAFKVIATFSFTLMFACVRWLGHDFPTGQVVFYRGFGAVTTIVIAALFSGGLAQLGTRRPVEHAYRSLCGAASMFLNFTALKTLSLATTTIVGYASPLFVILMAAIALKEKIHAYRWGAVAAGFVGVFFIVGPAAIHADYGDLQSILMVLTAAAVAAYAMIILRRMSGEEPSITIAFYFSLITAVLGFLTWPLGWNAQSGEATFILLLSGLFGGIGQLFLSASYRYSEASVLAPFDYTSILWATTLGAILFQEIPGSNVWIGAAIIIASGLVIFWRERQLGKARAIAASADVEL